MSKPATSPISSLCPEVQGAAARLEEMNQDGERAANMIAFERVFHQRHTGCRTCAAKAVA